MQRSAPPEGRRFRSLPTRRLLERPPNRNERFVASYRSVGRFAPQSGDRFVLGVERCLDPPLHDKRDSRVAHRPQLVHTRCLYPVLRPAPDGPGIPRLAQPRMASTARRARGHIHHDGYSHAHSQPRRGAEGRGDGHRGHFLCQPRKQLGRTHSSHSGGMACTQRA